MAQEYIEKPHAKEEDGFLSKIWLALTSGSAKLQIVDSDGEAVSVTDGRLDVNSSAPIGGATEAKQDTLLAEVEKKTEPTDSQLSELILSIKNLFVAIANPSWVDKSANALRVGTTAVTLSSTNVTTVTNLTNVGTFSGDHLQRMTNMDAWANNVRRLIS